MTKLSKFGAFFEFNIAVQHGAYRINILKPPGKPSLGPKAIVRFQPK